MDSNYNQTNYVYMIQGIPYKAEISGSRGGEREDGCLLGCCAV
jgi:hypothetical protein